MSNRMDFDVIVVGGGPAGAVTALKCSLLGFNVVLLERDPLWSKPCGGLLPPSSQEILCRLLGTRIPGEVLSSPSTLKVYYVHPDHAACAVNYELLSVKRRLLDMWLREYALRCGVNIWCGAELMELTDTDPIKALVRIEGRQVMVNARYLVGADGVFSRTRSQLGIDFKVAPALQEYWVGEGRFKEYFYVFFSGELTEAYAYLIPKDGLLVVGIWAPHESMKTLEERIKLFKRLLKEKFSFRPHFLVKREVWAIPYQPVVEGAGNIILVGDAGGFCNTLTGEGIRYAVESALAAGESILEAHLRGDEAAQIYREKVRDISSFLSEMHKLANSLTDEDRRNFISLLHKSALRAT